MKKQKLILEQIDRKILLLKKVEGLSIPSSGWVNAIRQSLGMSLRQIGNKMNITAQSVKEIEDREIKDTISINVLKQFGNALNMKFVYGFIPRNKNLEEIIDQRARELAHEIVSRTSINMKLEDQENRPDRIKKAISDKADEIKLEMPKYLWD
jgi:predicted DNA-binding mobile mystery protein A